MWRCGTKVLIVGVGGLVGGVVAEGEEAGERLNLGHCSSRKAERGSKGVEGGGGDVEVDGVGVVWTEVGAERMEECISDVGDVGIDGGAEEGVGYHNFDGMN